MKKYLACCLMLWSTLGFAVDLTKGDAAAVLATLNQIRQAQGLPALVPNDALSKMASEHARYLAEHPSDMHQQTDRESPFFTGETVDARCDRLKAGFSCAEVIAPKTSDWNVSLRSLLRGIYHRKILLDPLLNLVGVGEFRNSKGELTHVVNFAAPTTQLTTMVAKRCVEGQCTELAKPALMLAQNYVKWPIESSVLGPVHPITLRGQEIPDPLTDDWPVSGYLLSINAKTPFKVLSWSVKDEATAQVFDSQYQADPNSEETFWLLKTKKPFDSAARYSVLAKVVTKGVETELRWQFQTKSNLKLKALDVETGAEIKPDAYRKNQKIKLFSDSVSDSVSWKGMCIEFANAEVDSVIATINDLGPHCFVEAQDTQFQNQVIRILFNKGTTPTDSM
nr:CAP domain-containing protein [uncultured Deefgea sp.]